jgi:hypothetical protein
MNNTVTELYETAMMPSEHDLKILRQLTEWAKYDIAVAVCLAFRYGQKAGSGEREEATA